MNCKSSYFNIETLCESLAIIEDYILSQNIGATALIFDEEDYFLYNEYYKTDIYNKAKILMEYKKWKKEDIGNGKISDCVIKAINIKENNLVYYKQKILFESKIKENPTQAEEILSTLYCENDDENSFKRVVEFFGERYDLAAFLFFLKNREKYMPISPENFDKIFGFLGINFKTSYKCCWDNYTKYNLILDSIKNIIEETFEIGERKKLRLIDAHSFLWIGRDLFESDESKSSLQKIKKEKNFLKEKTADAIFYNEHNREYESYRRNPEIARLAKEKANGICGLCNCNAPFSDSHEKPFLEAHHIDWLSWGGNDTINNVIALCPNCHRKMHILNLDEDVAYLKSKVNS